MDISKNIVDQINKLIDKRDFDAAYDLFQEYKNTLLPKEKEELQYAFPEEYFKKIEESNMPYYKRIEHELKEGKPNLAYEIYLKNVGSGEKERTLFLNQCFSASKGCKYVGRKWKIEDIIGKILPEHEQHVKEVMPDYSLDYSSFCNEVQKLYDNYDINNHDFRELKIGKMVHDLEIVRELIETGNYKEANELFNEINQRDYNDKYRLDQSNPVKEAKKKIVGVIVKKINSDSDVLDAIQLCKTDLLTITNHFIIRDRLSSKIEKSCLDLFELGQYDEINNCYKELSETKLFNDRDVSDEKERTFFTLIDPEIRVMLDDDIVDKDRVTNLLLSDETSRILINENLISEESLKNYLNNKIDRHNNDIKAETKRIQELLDERREETDESARRNCDSRVNDIRKHGVKNLYHFTKLCNIKSILKYGILPVEMLNDFEID